MEQLVLGGLCCRGSGQQGQAVKRLNDDVHDASHGLRHPVDCSGICFVRMHAEGGGEALGLRRPKVGEA